MYAMRTLVTVLALAALTTHAGARPPKHPTLDCSAPLTVVPDETVESIKNCGCGDIPASVTTVRGDVVIEADAGVTELCFNNITTVRGSIDAAVVGAFPGLESVSFGELQTVGGDINLHGNYRLGSIHLGDTLHSVDGQVDLSFSRLSSITFGSIRSVGGSLNLNGNHLDGIDFGSLSSVGGDVNVRHQPIASIAFGRLLGIAGEIKLYDGGTTLPISKRSIPQSVDLSKAGLTGIDFGAITKVDGTITLGSDITSIAFGQLQDGTVNAHGTDIPISKGVITQDVNLSGSGLTDVEFGFITEVDGDLRLDSNDLTSVDFGDLTKVEGDLRLDNNKLTSIDFGDLTEVDGTITLGSGITSIAFGGLQNGTIDVDGTSMIVDSGGIWGKDLSSQGLTRIDFGDISRVNTMSESGGYAYGTITLGSNITSIAFGQLQDGTVNVHGTDIPISKRVITQDVNLSGSGLTDVGFGSITSVDGDLLLSFNDQPTSVDFGQITSVGGDLYLNNNDLTSVDFGQITSVGGDLWLYSNKLTSIDFGSITEVDGLLQLSDNDLTSVDCKGLGSCVCTDKDAPLNNCPERCSGCGY